MRSGGISSSRRSSRPSRLSCSRCAARVLKKSDDCLRASSRVPVSRRKKRQNSRSRAGSEPVWFVLTPSEPTAAMMPQRSICCAESARRAYPRRCRSDSRTVIPKSKRTGSATPPRTWTIRLPAWGSALKKPSTKSCWAYTCTTRTISASRSTPCAASASSSVTLKPSSYDMAKTRCAVSDASGRGTTAGIAARRRLISTSSRLAASTRKSSSLYISPSHACITVWKVAKRRSIHAISLAIRRAAAMSFRISGSTPSCCTFTTTGAPPSRTRATCTCATDADAIGVYANSEKRSAMRRPKASRTAAST